VQRSNNGLTRELQVPRDRNMYHPASGGSHGYPLFQRYDCLQVVTYLGLDVATDMVTPSRRSLYRWMNRIEPYKMTGNKENETIVGRDLMLLVTVVYVWPDATAHDYAAFIYNNGGGLYSQQDINSRLKALEISRKKASLEAYDAFSDRNMLRAELFWSQPPPLGVVGVERRRLIDVDECGIALEKCNSKYGYSHVSVRVRKPGHYKRDVKVTVIMAIEPGDPTLPANIDGSREKPRRWITARQVAGTSAIDFSAFCNTVCTSIETHPAPGDVDHDRVFLWDNLRSHYSALVAQTVEGRPTANIFRIVPRPPYQPKYGPIEYIFCELSAELQRRVQPDWNSQIMTAEILQISRELGCLGKFDNTFDHCGY
jgi:hypothetical protein